MKIKIVIMFLASALTAVSCSGSGVSSSNSGPEKQSLPTPPDTSNTVASDSSMTNANAAANTASEQSNFYLQAAQSGLAEVELGRLASQKAQNAEVKSFAQMMVADHGKANAELQNITARKQLMLPAVLSAEHQSAMSVLQGLSGAEFDKAYVDAMVSAHEKDVELFRQYADSGPDADAKAFAAKTLPTLQKHLEMIKGIRAKTR